MAITQIQREFVKDASHKLRDLITVCRGHLELLWDDPNHDRRTIALVIDELERMGRMVDRMQLLAEAQQPDFLRLELTDVELVTHELAARASALGSRRWLVDHAAEGRVVVDQHRLTEAAMALVQKRREAHAGR